MILQSFPRKRLFTRDFVSPLAIFVTPVRVVNSHHRWLLKLTLIASLSLHIAFFQIVAKKLALASDKPDIDKFELNLEDIPPPTEQISRPPPPPRPSIPIPSEDPDIPEDLTISETDLDFDEEPPPPPPPPAQDEGYRFIPYDSPPEPIGGFASLQKYLKYPELALRAGVEGKVFVGVLVDEEGNGVKTQILKDSGANVGFEEEAQKAVLQMKWKPAKQRDRPIQVWISVTVNFQLQSN